MTLINPAELERELDEQYLAEMRWRLDRQMRGALVDWARGIGGNFFFAVYDAGRGYWDNVRNDLRRGKITHEQAGLITDKAVEYRLITGKQADVYKAQFHQIQANYGELQGLSGESI